MSLKIRNAVSLSLALAAAVLSSLPARGQVAEANETAESYARESFIYGGADGVDPFRPPIGQGELVVRFEDLILHGIIHHEDPAQSIAILSSPGADSRIHARAGERIGAVRVLEIRTDRVEVAVEEDGVSRREILVPGSRDAIQAPEGQPGSVARIGTPAPPAESPGGGDSQRAPAERITVRFLETDVRDVLAVFAEIAGRSIIPGTGVGGEITATIHDQPWEIALRSILGAYGLAVRELPGGILQVEAIDRSQERQTLEPLVTRTFRVNYVPVGELAAVLEPLRSERGGISTNPTTNTLIITEVETVLATMEEILQLLDIRTPQVSIQAKIVFLNRTEVEELGVTYDFETSRGSSASPFSPLPAPVDPDDRARASAISLGGSSIAALGNANVRIHQPQLEVMLSLLLGRHTLTAFIDALRARELSDVQATPTITTLDNQPAEIWVGERTPIRVVDAGAAGQAGTGVSAPRATAELVETGIRLRVTPTITADRRILMQLHAERSSAQLAATDIGVVFQQQQGTTRLMVRDGETAVIGGLTVTETSTTTAGIPVLMDLPIIGAIFRTTRAREQKRDLLILVTPRIVDDPA